jgi:hypothetical protein
MGERVRAFLEDVQENSPHDHHFGGPFVSSYQIAIALDADDPALTAALGKAVGGAGTGTPDSVAQYVGNELSKQIKAEGDGHYAAGAFMSNEAVQSLVYRRADGGEVASSLVGTDIPMALFRLRSST